MILVNNFFVFTIHYRFENFLKAIPFPDFNSKPVCTMSDAIKKRKQ